MRYNNITAIYNILIIDIIHFAILVFAYWFNNNNSNHFRHFLKLRLYDTLNCSVWCMIPNAHCRTIIFHIYTINNIVFWANIDECFNCFWCVYWACHSDTTSYCIIIYIWRKIARNTHKIISYITWDIQRHKSYNSIT